MDKKSLVIGDGGWGMAIAMSLYRAGRGVHVWGFDSDYTAEVARTRENSKFLPGIAIPEDILWTSDVSAALDGVEEIFSVVPTQFLRPTMERFQGRIDDLPIFSASKGLELSTLKRPTEILADIVGGSERLGIASGPSHAEETAHGLATSVVAAAYDPKLAKQIQAHLSSASMRVYTSDDLVGVELGGALKNIIALGAGIADGIGLGDNAKAALVSRGLVEMARLGSHYGAKRETFFGLSGAGDLMVTCYSQHSRNRSLGEAIGRGQRLKDILANTEKVAEGVWTCKAIQEAAHDIGVDMPITQQIYEILFDEVDPKEAVKRLMERPAKPE
ncbi:MAG: NAD(P)-dependent glycerol-3-phosphate dehydrogenase [Planctomycetes bacterium]|nr:NAD(P)-dependent glycerol-3-phosphate dehydrogenase [Planctomycetota bacterium]MCP4770451.1 NAD(P)-dependent glycerol-3-phosphate dehydrogenase [Planctomycetota bacterium]MCP4859891.1 NAD(P)-dependent glycerol-3-phosphate dehydrogenase [Planctomycetota bacterium]